MSHWIKIINSEVTMNSVRKCARMAAVLCVALIQTVGAYADSSELQTRRFNYTPVSISKEGQANEPNNPHLNENAAPGRAPYYLRHGDQLLLELSNPGYEFYNEVTIDNQGTVNLNLLSWVNLEGKTVEQAETMLKRRYKSEFFKNPRISLKLIKKAPLRFKILGQVASPGFYEVPPELRVDLLDAIAIAGGYTRLANKVTYKYLTQDTKDAPTTEKIEIYKIRELKRAADAKIPVLNGDDTIVVGESIF